MQWVVYPLLMGAAGFVGAAIKGRYDLKQKRVEGDSGVRQKQVEGDSGVEQKRAEAVPGILENVLERLKTVEGHMADCEKELLQRKSNESTLLLAIDLILQKCPQADGDVRTAIRRMKQRQKDYFVDEGAPAGGDE